MPTIIISGLLIAYVAFVINKKVKDKKAGKTCGSCGGCSVAGKCNEFGK